MSYDIIDRFLRNNLGDDDYAEYSAALDSLCAPPRKPLTDKEIDLLREKHSEGRGSGWRFDFKGFARSIETAHNIKE